MLFAEFSEVSANQGTSIILSRQPYASRPLPQAPRVFLGYALPAVRKPSEALV